MSTPSLSRRDWLKLSAAGVVSYSLSGWLESLAADPWDELLSSASKITPKMRKDLGLKS